jgi:hypothetical protein
MNPTKSYQYSIDKELDSLMNDSSILRRSPSSSINMKIEDLPEPDLSRISDLSSFDRSIRSSSSDSLIDMKSLPSLDLSTKHALDEVLKKKRPRRFKKSKKKKKKIRIISGQVEKKKREEREKKKKNKRKKNKNKNKNKNKK